MTLYATVEDLKSYLRIPSTDTVDDVELERALAVASNIVEHLCSQTFDVAPATPYARYFGNPREYYYTRRRWTDPLYRVPIPALQDSTGLTVETWNSTANDYSTVVTGWELRPRNAPEDGQPWTELVLPSGVSIPAGIDYPLQVTARWGWLEVPAGVETATLLQAARVFKRRDAAFGVISTPDGATNTRLLNRVDPDVEAALRGYIKYWTVR